MIERALREIFPATCEVEACVVGDPAFERGLAAEELLAVARAIAKRRREFAAGRAAARAALGRLGVAGAVIPVGADRAPCWPEGIRGSITHAGALAAAVAARAVDIAAIGVDVEVAGVVRADVWPRILTAGERAWVEGFAGEEPARWATLIFSAKEAFYKFQHPLTRAWIDFDAVEIEADIGAGTFSVVTAAPITLGNKCARRWAGRFAFAEGYVVTGLALAVS